MVSEFFIPIYEANLARQKKPFSAIQTEADMNFYEREFIDWLRNKFGKKLSALTYPTYCTQKYFQLFISGFKSMTQITPFKSVALGGEYKAATNLKFFAEISHAWFNNGKTGAQEHTGSALSIGTVLSF